HQPRPVRRRSSARRRAASTARRAPAIWQCAPVPALPRSPSGNLDKGLEDPAIGLVDLEFRMPLDPETEAMARIFDALDDPVLGDGIDDEAWPGLLDRLVVGAIDREAEGPGDAVQQRPSDHADGVPGLVPRVRLAVRHATR